MNTYGNTCRLRLNHYNYNYCYLTYLLNNKCNVSLCIKNNYNYYITFYPPESDTVLFLNVTLLTQIVN